LRFLSFRNRQFLRRFFLFLLILMLVATIVAVGLFVYLQRYLVYGKEDVYLDFSRPAISTEQQAPPPHIDYPDTELVDPPAEEPEQTVSESVLSGYLIPHSALMDPDALLEQLLALPEPCTLLFDVKDSVGNFFYSTAMTGQGEDSRELVGYLITALKENGFHLVARVSALRDRSFALENTDCGLPLANGALWMDAGGCYWLDPADDEVQVRLVRICAELFELGFSEVVLSHFVFPETDSIVYPYAEDLDAVLATSFLQIRSALEGSGLVSIQLAEQQSAFDPGTGRFYYVTEDAHELAALRDDATPWVQDPFSQMVFLTESRDTRFDGYSILRVWGE